MHGARQRVFEFPGGNPDGAEAVAIDDAGDITGWFEVAPNVQQPTSGGEALDVNDNDWSVGKAGGRATCEAEAVKGKTR